MFTKDGRPALIGVPNTLTAPCMIGGSLVKAYLSSAVNRIILGIY
jgi:hypothetical protein